MIHYDFCPVCNSNQLAPALTAKDHTVSGEKFVITKCDNCSLMFTQDVPEQDKIGAYYASENYISHSNTQKGLVNRLYHMVRNRTLVSKRKLVEKETGKRAGNILDIGCGTGAFLNEMRNAEWKITGLEPDPTARKNAETLFNIHPQAPQELFSLPIKSYDAITMWHVLEHVHQLHEYVNRFSELLSPNGVLFIAVPNYTSKDAAIYGESWAAYDVPRHLYHFSPQSMKVLMEKHGLSVTAMKPMLYDSFYVSMLSEQYKNGKGNFVAAMWNGLRSNMACMADSGKCSSVIYVIRRKTTDY